MVALETMGRSMSSPGGFLYELGLDDGEQCTDSGTDEEQEHEDAQDAYSRGIALGGSPFACSY